MKGDSRAWDILVEELAASKVEIPENLLLKIHRIEERLQFDRERRDVAGQIRDQVQAVLDKEALKGGGQHVS